MVKKKKNTSAQSSHNDETLATKFSSGFLMSAVLVLGIVAVLGSYILGYQNGMLSEYEPSAVKAPSQPSAAAAPAPTVAAQPTVPPPPTVPKSAKPEVELFVMSQCPFGLQMEKAYVPVANLLGDKADMEIKYVSYAMHGLEEIEHNTRQYCIQQEEPEKFTAYLECYVQSTDTAACEREVGVDISAIDSCENEANSEFGIMDSYNDQGSWLSGRFPQYNLHKAENEEYGVQGSPTLVINGQEVSIPRSSEALKQAICNAYENAPQECDEVLNMNQEQAGPGPIGMGTAAPAAPAAGCGV